MKNIAIILFALLTLMVSCTSIESINKDSHSQLSDNNVNLLALEKYGKNFHLTYNSSKEYILCTSISKSNIPNTNGISYFVYDNISHSIIEENKIRDGRVLWHSDYEIKIIEIPGMIQKNQTHENGYILNVKTKSKTKIDGGVH